MQEQYQLASGPVVKGAKVSVGLPEGLATMQDIAEGLQLSQQFNTTSQMLMREIIAMRDTLAVFNSGISNISFFPTQCCQTVQFQSHSDL